MFDDDDDASMALWQLHLCSWIAFVCLFCVVVVLFCLFGLFFCVLVACPGLAGHMDRQALGAAEQAGQKETKTAPSGSRCSLCFPRLCGWTIPRSRIDKKLLILWP